MPKHPRQDNRPKTPTPASSLQAFLSSYPAVTLHNALGSLEGSTGWEVFRAYVQFVQRRYEVDALDLITQPDKVQAAAYASGYAKCAADLTESFLPGLRTTILGSNGVIENSRPEE